LSKNISFSGTTASRYSLALYELANENNSIDEVEKQSISFLRLIDESKDFSSLIKDPTNSVNELQDVINKIAENYKFNPLMSKFLGFLISKRRFFYVRTILQDFVDTCSKKRGEVKAELISSKELSGEQVNKIKDELSQNFDAKIKLDYKYDKSLIGGLVIQVGSIMVDTSIKNKLQQIENTMIEA
jgi:F-type H+-transporting ATPase subunit delta